MKPEGLRSPVSRASERVLSNGWEQTGDLCLVISSVLSKLACFMHTSLMPWKLQAEDDGSPKWKKFRCLYHHLENLREQDVKDFGLGDIPRFGVTLLQQLYLNLFDPDGRAKQSLPEHLCPVPALTFKGQCRSTFQSAQGICGLSM